MSDTFKYPFKAQKLLYALLLLIPILGWLVLCGYIVYSVVIFAATYISATLGSLINLLLAIFVIPLLAVNFFWKQTIESFFEFDILNVVKDNPGDYIVIVLKQYAVPIALQFFQLYL